MVGRWWDSAEDPLPPISWQLYREHPDSYTANTRRQLLSYVIFSSHIWCLDSSADGRVHILTSGLSTEISVKVFSSARFSPPQNTYNESHPHRRNWPHRWGSTYSSLGSPSHNISHLYNTQTVARAHEFESQAESHTPIRFHHIFTWAPRRAARLPGMYMV